MMRSFCATPPEKRQRRGTALLLVLFMVILLASVTMAASSAARSSGSLVTARRAQVTARSMAESGITSAVAVIDDSLRHLLADSLSRDAYLNSLDAGTNNGSTALSGVASDTIGDGAFAIAIVDVSARLDINSTSEAGLTRFLATFTPANAASIARDIAARVRGVGAPPDAIRRSALERDSLTRALLGEKDGPMIQNPFESLDELSTIPGFDAALFAKVAPLLTVDGVASVNRRSAPREVLLAAGGTQIDSPARLLVVSRGWQIGHVLTHEIQAVYDVSATGLRLVRWRERVL